MSALDLSKGFMSNYDYYQSKIRRNSLQDRNLRKLIDNMEKGLSKPEIDELLNGLS